MQRLFCILAIAMGPLAWASDVYYRPAPLPPVAWGVPLVGGPVRALFVGPPDGLRDADALAARLSLRYETIAAFEQGIAPLRERLGEKFDVFVFGGFEFTQLPDDIWDAMANRVESGTGLVLTYMPSSLPEPLKALLDRAEAATDAESITRGIGASMTPEWPTNMDFVSAWHCGAGRIVKLSYPGERPFYHMLAPPLTDPGHARDDFFDVYLSLAAKALRWAAGRMPAAWITQVERENPSGPSNNEIPPDLPPEYVEQMRAAAMTPLYQTYLIHFNAPLNKRYRVQAQVREPNRPLRLLYPKLPRTKKGQDTCRLDLPLGPGRYFLDLWIMDKKNVIEWHTEAVEWAGWPVISDVVYSKGHLMPNDAMTVALNVQPKLSGGVPLRQQQPCSVYVRATDSLGRLVAEGRKELGVEAERVEIPLAFADLIANMVKIEVFAADVAASRFTRWDLNRATYTSVYLPVRAPRTLCGFSLVADMPGASDYNARSLLHELIPLGFDSVHIPATNEGRFYLAALGLNPIPEVARYVPESVEAPGIRIPCLSDPVFCDEDIKRIREQAMPFWAVGSDLYGLGRGNRLGPLVKNTMNPSDAKSGLAPSPSEEVCLSPACLNSFQTWLRNRYGSLDALNRAWGAYFLHWEDVAPSVRSALHGSERYGAWLDWRLHMDAILLDTHERAETVIRNMDASACAVPVLMDAFGPEAGVDWWRMAGALDGLVIPNDPIAFETARSVKDLNPKPLPFYRGLHVSTVNNEAEARWLPWHAALHGMNALWVDTREISANTGNLSAMASAVTDLKYGLGAVLRDARRPPAPVAIVYSQASRYLCAANPELSDTDAAMRDVMYVLDRRGYAHDVVSCEEPALPDLKPYRMLLLPGVHALSDVACKAIREFQESGGHVWANVVPGRYDDRGARRGNPLDFVPCASDLETCLSEAPEMPPIACVSCGGTNRMDGEAYRFDYGSATIHALLRAPDAANPPLSKWILSLEKDVVAYDAVRGRRLPHSRNIEVKLAPGAVFVASALPYVVTNLRVNTLRSIESGRRLPVGVTVETDGLPPDRHVVHLSILRNQTQRLAYYDRVIECPKGQGSAYVPLALDEQAGSYALEARDALTGVSARILFQVERRPSIG